MLLWIHSVYLRLLPFADHDLSYRPFRQSLKTFFLFSSGTLRISPFLTALRSVAWRLAVGCGDQLLTGRWSHSPTSRFPSFPTPVVTTEPVPGRTGSLRHMSKEMGSYKQWNVCLRWHPDMSHIVDSCLLRKLDGGLRRLHTADKAACCWLADVIRHETLTAL